MRSLYFTAAESGLTRAQLRHAEAKGRIRKVGRATYRHGDGPVTPLDECLALTVTTGGVAGGRVSGVMLGLDAVTLGGPDVTLPPGSPNRHQGVRRRELVGEPIIVDGIACAGGLQTLVDLAAELDDLRWEQALESALRKELTTVAEIQFWLPEFGRRRTPGVARIQRVLALRPEGAPPTGSILETMFVQLRRLVPGSTEPLRQVEVRNDHDDFVAFVDFAWPDIGLFIELDGQHHLANRSTMRGVRQTSSRRPDGSSGGSPGTRSSATRSPPHASWPGSSRKPAAVQFGDAFWSRHRPS